MQRLLACLLLALLPLAGCGGGNAAQPDPGAATFVIQGQSVTLHGGSAARPAAPGSAAQVRTWVAAGPARGALQGPGGRDAAVVLAQDTGGSGTFYYLAAVLGGDRSTNAILLGDRIRVRALFVSGGTITVTYLDHAAGEPMAAAPTLRTVRRFQVRGGTLVALRG